MREAKITSERLKSRPKSPANDGFVLQETIAKKLSC